MPTSSGPITLPGAPTAALHAATKGYVDAPAPPRTMSATTAASVDGTIAGDMQITATGDTVITPTGTPNGRVMTVEVFASGAQRVPSVATTVALTTPVTSRSLTVPTGMTGLFGLRYSALAGKWLLMAASVQSP